LIRVLALKNSDSIRKAFHAMDVDEVGIEIMLQKAQHYLIQIDALTIPAANILKQELLSLGGDAALHRGACNFSIRETPCIMMGTHQHFERLSKKLAAQPFGLKKIAKELKQALRNFLLVPPTLVAGPFIFDFTRSPFVMGILNMTPDSFSGDGIPNTKELLKKAEKMLEDGADLLDVGGESTRPGATPVSVEEERKRVIPAIKALAKRFKIPISVDTSKGEIAEEALNAGAHLINDVSGLMKDPRMAKVAKRYDSPLVVMHHQKEEHDLIGRMANFFEERLLALEKEGIPRNKVILDPGIGFGKTGAENFFVLKRMEEFKCFGRPLLLGASRKSFIGHVLKQEANERLIGSVTSQVFGFFSGAHFFRVHDVREAREALMLSKAILEADV